MTGPEYLEPVGRIKLDENARRKLYRVVIKSCSVRGKSIASRLLKNRENRVLGLEITPARIGIFRSERMHRVIVAKQEK